MTAMAALLAMMCTLVLISILRRFAARLRLLDLPDARKQHSGAVPLVGGIAMFSGLLISCCTLAAFDNVYLGFLAGAAMMLTIGCLDDRRPLPALPRLVAQAAVIAFTIYISGNVLSDLGYLVSPRLLGLGALALPFTVFGVLGVVNAMNFIDGADGLAGGTASTALGWLLFVVTLLQMEAAVPSGVGDSQFILAALLGGLLGFLFFNLRTPMRSRAAVFMGDGGSLFIGFAVGWFAVTAASQFGPRGLAPVAALWIVIVPLFDTVACIVRRIRAGRSPLSPDRKHVHHLLEAWGLSTGQAVTALIAVNALGGLIGVAGWRLGLPDYVLFAAIATCFAGYLAISSLSWQRIDETDTGVYIVTASKWSSAMRGGHLSLLGEMLLHSRPKGRADF